MHNPLTWTDPLGLAPCLVRSPGRAAPDFVAGGGRGVIDVRRMGRADNQLVLSGHGGIRAGDGSVLNIPPGTSLHAYSRHGDSITDSLGNRIETGNPSALEIYIPGEKIPDYSLFPGHGLNIMGVPRNITVANEVRLSELLRPNMGPVHWAACRSVF
ncbi:putative adhesin [Streptomyces sp. NPDC058045]|uniref:putative adhesin n=1 Tax=Streptomyces sp. NPDC058045 TaxID=3346311 RepID=UPI0036E26D82